jgi:Tol biopolymer transport system component
MILRSPPSRLIPALARVAAALVTALGPAPVGAASWVQLSDGAAFSDVRQGGYRLSPDGRWAVYVEDADADEAAELWSVPVFGGTPRRISGLLPAGSGVTQFAISPDSATVVYIAPQDALGVDELFRVPIAGGLPIQLNGALVLGGDVNRFAISPDGQRVVYSADQEADERIEIYSVPADGGTPTRLNGALEAGADAYDFAISPEGLRVVYEKTGAAPALYCVPITGGASTLLTGAFVLGGQFTNFRITPDGQRVLYVADQQTHNVPELYSVPLLGGTVAKLNGALDPSYFVYSGLKVSPDGSRVVFLTGTAVGPRKLYSSPAGGGGWTRLNPDPAAFGFVLQFAISPDGQQVVFAGDQDTLHVQELYVAPVAGGAVTKLNGTLVADGAVIGFQIAGSGDWVVYLADEEVDGFPTGHRVPLAGPAASAEQIWYRVYAAANGDYAIDADRGRVLVRGNAAFVDGVQRLWSFPLTGTPDPGGGTELVPKTAFTANGDVESFSLAPQGTILYRGDQTIDEQFELYAVPAMIFWDGFESADTTAWSAVAP